MSEIFKIIAQLETVGNGAEKMRDYANDTRAASKAHDDLLIKMKAYESLAKNSTNATEKLDFAKKAREARAEYEKLNGTLSRETGIIEGLRAEVLMLGQAMEQATDEGSVRAIGQRLNLSRQRLNDLTGGGATQATAATGGLRQAIVGGAVGGVVALGLDAAADMLWTFKDTVIDSTVEYEKFKAALFTSYGSMIDAEGAMSMLVDTAAQTPSQLNEVTEAFIKFKGRGLEPTQAELIQISDVAVSQGKSINQYADAILDAMSGENERLKEFGIQAQRAGDKTKFTFRGVTTEVDNSAESINNYLVNLGKVAGVAGASKAGMETLGGAISNLGDNFSKLGVSIGTSTGILKSVVSGVSELIGTMADYLSPSFSEKIEEQRQGFENLSFQILAANEGTSSRNDLIAQMRAQYPDFLNFLSLETLGNEELAKTLDIVNGLYSQRITKELFKENEKQALDNYNESLSTSRSRLNDLLTELRDMSDKTKVPFNPIDIVGAEGDASKLYTIVDKLSNGYSLIGRRGKELVKQYIQSYQETLDAQKQYQDSSNESAKAANAAEINTLEKLNEAIQISIDSNTKKLQANANDAALKAQIAEEQKGKRINELKLRLLKEANTLELAERKKIQSEIDALEGKTKPKQVSDSQIKKIQDDAKKRKEAYEKAAKDLTGELEKQRSEIEKLQLPKEGTKAAITAGIEYQKKEELKALDNRYNALVKELQEKGIGKAQIDALGKQKGDIEAAINEKFKIKLEFDLNKFNEAKQKLIDDIANKDFEFKANLRISSIKTDDKATLSDLMIANELLKEMATRKLTAERNAQIKDLEAALGSETPELAAAVESLNLEYEKLFDAESQKQLENNAKDALSIFQKTVKKIESEASKEVMNVDIAELEAIKALNQQGITNKEAYEKAKTDIQQAYAQLRLEITAKEIDAEIQALENAIKEAEIKGANIEPLKAQLDELNKRKLENQTEQSAPTFDVSNYDLNLQKATEYFDAIKSGYEGLTSVIQEYVKNTTGAEIEALNARIEAQQRAVDGTKELLAEGNVAAYEDEKATLQKLQDERDKAAAKEKRINSAIQITNAALSASYAALAIAKAVAVDPTGITTAPRIAGIIAAGAAGLASIIALFASVKGATSAKEGKDYVGRSDTSIGTDASGTREYPYILHHGEMVVPAKQAEILRGLGGFKAIPQLAHGRIASAQKEVNSLVFQSQIKNGFDMSEFQKQTSIIQMQLDAMAKQNQILIQGFNALKKQSNARYD